MKVETYGDREQWLEARRGRITGTRAGSLFSKRDKNPLKGLYEVIAERVALPPDGEAAMDRGTRLEEEAVARFEKETGKKVDTSLVIWARDEDANIAISPDGFIETGKGKKKAITEAVECKCLNSASHIEAFMTNQIPSEYEAQKVQYFVVNDALDTLHFVFYDPRMPKIDMFEITVKREDVQAQVDEFLEMERLALEAIADAERQLTF